ncbi:hypothetical protein BR93DRAFT_87507 [Coniochaeta sp. PMI_546]|nr:hypothetical protein BR93DRAFT_87507 [Coniochaeta sp. PMI_546]
MTVSDFSPLDSSALPHSDNIPHCPISPAPSRLCPGGRGGCSTPCRDKKKERIMYPRTSRVSKRRTGTRQCGTVWRNRYLPFATPHRSEATCFCFFNFCNFHPRNFHSALHPLTEPILFCSIPDRPFKVTAASPSFPPSKNSFLKVCYLPHTKTPNIPHQLEKDVILPSPKHLYCNIATSCRGPSLDFCVCVLRVCTCTHRLSVV